MYFSTLSFLYFNYDIFVNIISSNLVLRCLQLCFKIDVPRVVNFILFMRVSVLGSFNMFLPGDIGISKEGSAAEPSAESYQEGAGQSSRRYQEQHY